MSNTINLAKPGRTVHVGVILMGGETEILDVAPVDLLYGISSHINDWPDEVFSPEQKKQAFDMEFHWVNEKGDIAKMTAGLRIQPTDTFATCPPLDIAIMGAHHISYTPNEKELEFVRKSYDDCSAFIAICGGSQAPMQAGLLKDKTVTGPEPWLPMLEKLLPGSKVEKRRWVRDGKLWTSGTLLNGLDLMRAFGEQTYGTDGTLMGRALDVGAWPVRDVNFADVKA